MRSPPPPPSSSRLSILARKQKKNNKKHKTTNTPHPSITPPLSSLPSFCCPLPSRIPLPPRPRRKTITRLPFGGQLEPETRVQNLCREIPVLLLILQYLMQ